MDSSRSQVLVVDESLRGNIIAVGGYIVTADKLQGIARKWRALKRDTFGIEGSMELKYTMPKGHPTRRALDSAGWEHQRRVPAMLDTIAQLDVTLLVDVLVDVRQETRPDQLYLDGLGWCMRRAANDVVGDAAEGPHWAIVDMPPQAGELDAGGVSERLRTMHEHVGTAAFDFYQNRLAEPEPYGWGGQLPPLWTLGFAPTLLAAHARHADVLQVADIVVGAVRDLVWRCHRSAHQAGRLPTPGWPEGNVRRIGAKFRRGRRVCGWGVDVFPRDAVGVPEIRQRLEALCWAGT